MLDNKAIVIVIQRNAEKYLRKSLTSAVVQDYEDIGIIFIDDASEDGSVKIAHKILEDRRDTVFTINRQKTCKLESIRRAITEQCTNSNSTIFWLDGDDYLTSSTAISEMMELHEHYDVVWSQHIEEIDDGRIKTGCSGPITNGNVREGKWVSSALRSFKKFLFDEISENAFLDANGKLYEKTIDQAIMYPVLEMAGPKKWHFYDKKLYFYTYNPKTMRTEGKGNKEQLANESHIRGKKPYPILLTRKIIRGVEK